MKVARAYFVLFAFSFASFCHAQKEDYVWVLGTDKSPAPGIQALTMDWNSDTLTVRQEELGNGVGSQKSSICDTTGVLLFWTNGCSVMNREQDVMPHGDTLNWDVYREVIPGRDECTRGYPNPQGAIIINDPGYASGYYIVHKAQRIIGDPPIQDVITELRMSYVDITLDEGLGDVVFFDSTLYDQSLVQSCLDAILHENGEDWWIINPVVDQSYYVTLLVDSNGVHQYDEQPSSVQFTRARSTGGTARFSPDGLRYAFYDYFLNVHLYDFDRSSGLLSNHQKITLFDSEDLPNEEFKFGSVEWSSNSRFLYVTNRDSLMQIDTWESDLQAGIRLIDVWDGTVNPFANTFYLMNLGPDCKIYMCSTSGNQSLHVIEKPNELGVDCSFVQNKVQLPQSLGVANLTLFPRFRVDEAEKCDPSLSSVFGQQVYYRRDLHIFPNPAQDYVTIEVPRGLGHAMIEIYQLDGRLIKQSFLGRNQPTHTMDISSFSSGIYHIEIYPEKNPDRIFYRAQLVKE